MLFYSIRLAFRIKMGCCR